MAGQIFYDKDFTRFCFNQDYYSHQDTSSKLISQQYGYIILAINNI